MASPPNLGSKEPLQPPPLALPKQRPVLALPGQQGRKTSISSSSASAPTPLHPLRQTSFPPRDVIASGVTGARQNATLSPTESLEDVSDGEINSVISASMGEDNLSRKRKRGERRTRGKASKAGSGRFGSVQSNNGEDVRTPGRRSGTVLSHVTGAEDAEGEEEEEEEEEETGTLGGRLPLYDGGQMTAEEIKEERERKRAFYDSVPEVHRDRSEAYHRAKLRTADVRRLVNQTLSQSVPQNVVLVVASYTKLFAGMLIEEARAVQTEWMATEELLPCDQKNPAFKKLSAVQREKNGSTKAEGLEADGIVSPVEHVSPTPRAREGNSYTEGNTPNPPLMDGLVQTLAECDRGPLLPDHLRLALRRLKKSRRGGTVGFTGLSLEGRDVAAPRMGGRKLFK